MSLEGRLRRLEERRSGDRCQDCGLASDERRPIAVVNEEHPERSFAGDPDERCASCDLPLHTVFNVVYDPPVELPRGEGRG